MAVRRTISAAIAVIVVCLLPVSPPSAAEPTFPVLTGRVVDQANILSASTETRLERWFAGHESATSEQIVAVTLLSLQGFTIEDFGYRLGRHWGIGQKGKDNGLLLIVAPNERKVRIEVGYGLEGRMTDAIAGTIIQQVILPRFRSGDMEGGIVSGARAIVEQLGGKPDDGGKRKTVAADRSTPVVLELFVAAIFLAFFVINFVIFLRGDYSLGRGHGDVGIGGGGFGGGGFGGGFSGGGGGFGGGGASGGW
ncbi:MAG: TPM domain-containing protein [Rhodospirillales bacterium]